MENKEVEAVLFDLDGTIIDSYSGIQSAFDRAYSSVYHKENAVSIKALIGPPIQKILYNVNGEVDSNTINAFVSFYKKYYDSEEYKRSVLYSEIEELFKELANRGIKMFVATNKRKNATELILSYLSLSHYFCRVYCPDSNISNYSTKVEMVKDLLEKEDLKPESCFLVGDTAQDEIAAKENKIPFIYASYGYGKLIDIEKKISKPMEVLRFINNI